PRRRPRRSAGARPSPGPAPRPPAAGTPRAPARSVAGSGRVVRGPVSGPPICAVRRKPAARVAPRPRGRPARGRTGDASPHSWAALQGEKHPGKRTLPGSWRGLRQRAASGTSGRVSRPVLSATGETAAEYTHLLAPMPRFLRRNFVANDFPLSLPGVGLNLLVRRRRLLAPPSPAPPPPAA